jgi:hypothetical protein
MSSESAMEKGEIGATSQGQVDPDPADGQSSTTPTRELSLPLFNSTSTGTLLGSPSIDGKLGPHRLVQTILTYHRSKCL